MITKFRHKRWFSAFDGVLIICLQTALFAWIWYGQYAKQISVPFWNKGNWVVIGLYMFWLTVFYKLYGALKVGYLRLFDLLWGQLLSLGLLAVVMYVQIALINGWFVSVWPMVTLFVLGTLLSIVWGVLSNYIYIRLCPPYRMLAISGGRDADSLIRKMNRRREKYNIQDIISADEEEDVLLRKIEQYEAVVVCDVPSHVRNRIVKACYEKNVRVYITPKLSDIILMSSDNLHLFDTPLLLVRNRGLTLDQRIAKRCFDIVVAILIAVVFSPVMLLVSILIKAYDGGDVFYKQERLGLDGKEFMIYKFRSMCMDSEKNGAQLAKENDDRITPVGKVIRKLHIDEIPQVLNVLKGEMSMVGPRPERGEIAKMYQDRIPEFDFRLKMKPGLTGYAQVYGKYNTTPYDKLKLDLLYIMNYSIWLDVRLLFMTVKILFQKENSEGVKDGQKTALKDVSENDGKNEQTF